MRAEYEALVADISGLLVEAKKADPVVTPPPSKKVVQATLQRMSDLAHRQTQTAMQIGTPSALKLAAHTHLRVAHAAGLHGVKKLATMHAKTATDLHTHGKRLGQNLKTHLKIGKERAQMQKAFGSAKPKKAKKADGGPSKPFSAGPAPHQAPPPPKKLKSLQR